MNTDGKTILMEQDTYSQNYIKIFTENADSMLPVIMVKNINHWHEFYETASTVDVF